MTSHLLTGVRPYGEDPTDILITDGAIAAIGPAAWYKFFAAETGCAITAFACGDFDFCFVDEFHGVLLYFGFQTTFCVGGRLKKWEWGIL